MRRKTACPVLSGRIGAALVLQNQGFEVLDFPEDPFLQFINAATEELVLGGTVQGAVDAGGVTPPMKGPAEGHVEHL